MSVNWFVPEYEAPTESTSRGVNFQSAVTLNDSRDNIAGALGRR